MGHYSNISPALYRKFLKSIGLSFSHINSGHEVWKKEGMLRPVVFQTHIDPVPEFIVLNNLTTAGVTKKDIDMFLKRRK